MLPTSVSGVLSVALAAVVGWCLYVLIRRPSASTTDRVPLDVEAWHGAMGAAMLPLLWWMPSADQAWLGCALFAAMMLWCAVRGSRRRRPGHYGQVGVMAMVMVAMLVPAGAANAAAPRGHAAATAGMHDGSNGGLIVTGPAALAAVLLMALVTMLAVGRARRATGTRTRLSASCEGVMAAVMCVMALAMV